MSYATKCSLSPGYPVGTNYVSTTNGGIALGIGPNPPMMHWLIVTSADNPIQIQSFYGYICSGSSQCIFLLQLAPNLGDPFIILSSTSTFKITENGSQTIRIGAQISTAGSGYITSNTVGDGVEVYYIGSNGFLALPSQGTLSIT